MSAAGARTSRGGGRTVLGKESGAGMPPSLSSSDSDPDSEPLLPLSLPSVLSPLLDPSVDELSESEASLALREASLPPPPDPPPPAPPPAASRASSSGSTLLMLPLIECGLATAARRWRAASGSRAA